MSSMDHPRQAARRDRPSPLQDRRFHGHAIQAVVLLALLGGIGWLAANLAINLDRRGLDISFRFLLTPTGYDINQTPIPYDSRDTHLRAALVGAVNTVIVAVLACATATVLGVVAGVLRLSGNWIVARLMAVYVEMFRNIPVLIWIIIVFTVIANLLPAPGAFRGEDAARALFGVIPVTNRGVYLPWPSLAGGASAWSWAIVGAVLAASVAAALGLRGWAGRRQAATGLRPRTWPAAVALLVLPISLALWALGLSWDVPVLQGFNFAGGMHLRNSLLALWIALSIYSGAFIAENVRAGILAVDRGQTEAAAALGLRPRRVMALVVLPQALRIVVPPLISAYLNITKNTSLAIAVGYLDITGTLGGITLNQTGRALECVLLLMLFYLAASLAISAVMNLYDRSIAIVDR
ncbi:amino acid ABC transporter permease [Jannaschia formosa]|uniref:amino acid ABC transporter permease n=1 Tax=Jannaschia formosa TaxID=2259592 RepID=UPI000E1BADB6|nr:ABC transporter permease subunit [Jannaschia formosa]TFL18826.1 ABC transporter permease subunit [Jannaschia formosa]